MEKRAAFQQLYLFDCDGGRSSLFDEPAILGELPNSCKLHLFWNNDDSVIEDKLKRLGENQHIRLHPTRVSNGKNAADGKLIYYLGKSINQASTVTIVHGGDEIYREVVEEIRDEFPKLLVTLHVVKVPNPGGLRELIREMKRFEEEICVNTNGSDYLQQGLPGNPASVIIPLSKQCPKCAKKLKTVVGTMSHILNKHKLGNDDIVAIATSGFSQYHQEPVKENINNSKVASTSATPSLQCLDRMCANKKKRFRTSQALKQHEKDKHSPRSKLLDAPQTSSL